VGKKESASCIKASCWAMEDWGIRAMEIRG
jgi:hypothetical protein